MEAELLPIPIILIPGKSFLHRLHPLPKLAWVLGLSVVSFIAANPLVVGSLFAIAIVLMWYSNTLSALRKVLALLLPISLSMLVLQSLAPSVPQPWTLLASLGPVAIYREGIYSGLFRMLMIWSASSFGLLFIATTHPSDMFVALQRIGVPYELNFMVSASLQLIPILQKEFGAVLQAQRSRGLRVSGFGAALPSLVPVFSATVERVQQLALSLEARAFGSVGVKTNLREVSVSAKDYVAGALGLIVPASLGVFLYRNRHMLNWSRIQLVPDPVAVMLVIGSGALFLASLLRVLWMRRSE